MRNSEMTAEQRAAHNERMKVYMRGYRKRKKLASGAVIAIEESKDERGETLHTYAAEDAQSSPVEAPGAS